MAKQYGLIVPNKGKNKLSVASVFNQDSDSDEEVAKPTGLKRPLKKSEKISQNKAVEEDPTVYQYDEVYDEMDRKRKESKLSRTDLDKKPKYINKLLVAAEKRKRENERRIERQIQKEREAEGEEFKDKEAFVTSAYRKKLEEMKELEEQEKREEYLESIGDVRKQGNLDGFYRHLYDQKVNFEDKIKQESEDVKEENEDVKEENEEANLVDKIKEEEEEDKATEASDSDSKTSDRNKVEKAVPKNRKYRKRDKSDNSDEDVEEVQNNKEHLPSKLDEDSDFSIDSSDSEDEKTESKENEKVVDTPKGNAAVETTSVEVKEEKKEEVVVKEEVKEVTPPKPKIDIWKKRTVGEVFDAALQRYYERKAVREL